MPSSRLGLKACCWTFWEYNLPSCGTYLSLQSWKIFFARLKIIVVCKLKFAFWNAVKVCQKSLNIIEKRFRMCCILIPNHFENISQVNISRFGFNRFDWLISDTNIIFYVTFHFLIELFSVHKLSKLVAKFNFRWLNYKPQHLW